MYLLVPTSMFNSFCTCGNEKLYERENRYNQNLALYPSHKKINRISISSRYDLKKRCVDYTVEELSLSMLYLPMAKFDNWGGGRNYQILSVAGNS